MVRLRRALHDLRRPIDVLVYSDAQVEEWGDAPGTALHAALTEGRVLVERDALDVAHALLAKAAGDEAGPRALADRDDVPDHVAGFLAQQAIEKSLKAVLTARGARFERSHDIDYLCGLIEDNGLDLTDDLKARRRADSLSRRVSLRRSLPRPTHLIAPTRRLPWPP